MNIESIEHLQYQPSPYFADTLDTLNPSVTINGQTVSHSGTLANGSESPSTTLTEILSGPIQVDANIHGSRQAILKITGTRVLYEDSIILKGRTSNVYYGRYYGTFSPTTTTSDLIAVTNLQANITTLTYASNKLTLTIDSPSGTTSTTKVYCGDKGESTSVVSATSWSYNNTSKILTTTATHSSSITITVKWKFPGDVNDDGVVDASDLFNFSKVYGCKFGDPNWSPDCDFNRDNKVDASDLFDLSKNYGKKWKFAGDVNGDGFVDASDLFDLSKAYGSKSGDLNWNVDCDFNSDEKIDVIDLFDLSKNYGKNV